LGLAAVGPYDRLYSTYTESLSKDLLLRVLAVWAGATELGPRGKFRYIFTAKFIAYMYCS
jgi:hypothetical protein